MDTNSQRLRRQDGALSSLDAAIEAMNIAKEASRMTLASVVFGSVGTLLTTIRDSAANKNYVEVGLACADVCRALDRGTNGKNPGDLSQSVCNAIGQLATIATEIQEAVTEKGRGSLLSRVFLVKSDKVTVTAWKLNLYRILHIFNTELVTNTNVVAPRISHDIMKFDTDPMKSDTYATKSDAYAMRPDTYATKSDTYAVKSNTNIMKSDTNAMKVNTAVPGTYRTVLRSQRGTVSKKRPTQVSTPPGELPPPPPRACIGRDELIEEIVDLAESLTPIALIGAGGIGKTCVALSVLHHDRIKQWFGDNRWFIRCDQFPASLANFLNRLSKVIGAGVENPKDLTPLRPFLSSKEMIIFLDNAESILKPGGTDARELHAAVEELSRFETICLCISSRISSVPPRCKCPIIPTLSMGSACKIFFGIYDNGWSETVNNLLGRLDLHPLSITLLATAASRNLWDYDLLAEKWHTHRAQVIRVDCNRDLAATIELVLASPMFRELGPDARDILSVIAFFPQGINENNLNWLFPTISGRRNIFDKFCILSLTYRSNGSVTMLAPLREYLYPRDPALSPLLRTTKECYFTRLSVHVGPGSPSFEEAQWITSEDVNVEHLLDVLTTIDASSARVWDVCFYFMQHLLWHKTRLVVLGPKIEELPDNHRSKPNCLLVLSQLFTFTDNHAECKRILLHALKLYRQWGNDLWVAKTLEYLCEVNWYLDLRGERIRQANEALRIYERLNDKSGQAGALNRLARLSLEDNQLDAAEETASRAISLLKDKDGQYTACQIHRLLSEIFFSKGKTRKVKHHLDMALGIASLFNWHWELSLIHCSLAVLTFSENRFRDAHAHVESAKSHAVNDVRNMASMMQLQAEMWYEERRFGEAKAEALRAAEAFETLGDTMELELTRELLFDIHRAIGEWAPPRKEGFNALASSWMYSSTKN